MNQARTTASFTPSVDGEKNSWDSKYNTNNFYSNHDNNGPYVPTDAAEAPRKDTYSEKDQAYNAERLAHLHVDT